MYEISPGIFLGNRLDVRNFAANTDPHAIVHASHTAHKLLLGYRNAAPRNAEYLVARRENHLFLNIITHHSASFYHAPLFTAAIAFIKEQRSHDRQVLIYSDQGGNRPAGIALVYLAHERLIPHDSFEAAHNALQQRYPRGALRGGLAVHLQREWDGYVNESAQQKGVSK